jgi:ABC-2 type transport system ATP-binding protein
MEVISVDNLTKVFKPAWPGQSAITALSGLSFFVNQGEIFGFLGPNGAGKTTTIKIILDLMRPTSGQVKIFGKPSGHVEVRRRVGFLPESPYFYDYLTAEEFLKFYAHLGGVVSHKINSCIDELLSLVGLKETRGRQLRKFSKGMLQRIGLAQSLIHDPELVIFDEPMSGLDPIGRKHVRDLILGLRDKGKTILFSSHILSDVEMMCDRVGIVGHGRLRAIGRVDELVTSNHTRSVEVVFEGPLQDDWGELREQITCVRQHGRQCQVVLSSPAQLDEFLAAVRSHGRRLISVTPHKGSLEDLFVEKANHETQEKTAQ